MPEMPFLDRMGWIFVVIIVIMVIITLLDPKSKNNPKGLEVDSSMFKPSGVFAAGAILVCGILAALYTVFW
jgi:SSS family solute:Na+ symporter